MRARHTRFNRIATTIVASLGLASVSAISLVLVLHQEGAIDIKADHQNVYHCKFLVDGVKVYEEDVAKGEPVGYGYDSMPTKDPDVDGQLYQFIGWDITGEGIPDILPTRMYGNFTARAVFAKYGIPEIDWEKVDFERLFDLLNYFNIDIESFINFFGLTEEELMKLLGKEVFTFTSNYTGVAYFRTESFGDYDALNHKWSNAAYYDPINISSNSINPMQFMMNKLQNAGSLIPELANRTNIQFSIDYKLGGEHYPVPLYESNNTQSLPTDSYSLTNPENKHYETYGMPYSYIASKIINSLKLIPFSNDVIKQDELKYREYARENYLNIDDNMKASILNLLNQHDISFDYNYSFVDKINKMFADEYELNLLMKNYPTNVDPIMYFLNEAKEGCGKHFGAATTLIYRALGVPARYVQGYWGSATEGEVNSIRALQSQSWAEIYIDGIGWIATDSSVSSVSRGMLDKIFGEDEIMDFEAPIDSPLSKIEATIKKSVYQKNEAIDEDDIQVVATYENGQQKIIKNEDVQKIILPSTSTAGDKNIVVVYRDGTDIKKATIPIVVESSIIDCSIELRKDTFIYTGGPVVNENSLKDLLKVTYYDTTRKRNVELRLEDDERIVWDIEISPNASSEFYEPHAFSSIKDFINVGDFAFKIHNIAIVNIYNEPNEDYSFDNFISEHENDPYILTINPASVNVKTASVEDYYYGDPITISRERFVVEGGETDSVHFEIGGHSYVLYASGWAKLSNVGSTPNTFSSYYIERDGEVWDPSQYQNININVTTGSLIIYDEEEGQRCVTINIQPVFGN